MVNTNCHHAPPAPPRHARGPVYPMDPTQEACKCGAQRELPRPPPLTCRARNFWGHFISGTSPHTATSFFRRRGWRPIWGWPCRTSMMMFPTPPPPEPPGPSSSSSVQPPTHLCHPLRGGSPPRAGPRRLDCPLAGALLTRGGERRADRRRCLGAGRNQRQPTAHIAGKCVAARERRAGVHERQGRQAWGIDYSMSMRMRGRQTKCSLTNAKVARFSRDCALSAHCGVCLLFASRLPS